MDEYIAREAVRNALYDADAITMEGVRILNQYPAADVKPVVRCRDCANWDTTWEPETLPEGHFCLELALMTKADFFCAAGEKRETEDDQ